MDLIASVGMPVTMYVYLQTPNLWHYVYMDNGEMLPLEQAPWLGDHLAIFGSQPEDKAASFEPKLGDIIYVPGCPLPLTVRELSENGTDMVASVEIQGGRICFSVKQEEAMSQEDYCNAALAVEGLASAFHVEADGARLRVASHGPKKRPRP